MDDKRTEAEKRARTLEWLVESDHVPGLLPKDVLAAAELLREQERELVMLRKALTTKGHVVDVEVADESYRKRLSASFIITDPRIYHGEVLVDDYQLTRGDDDFLMHVSRQLTRAGTDQWVKDLETKTAVAFYRAIKGADVALPK